MELLNFSLVAAEHHHRKAEMASDGGGGEIMLFGVRMRVDPMRKTVSLNNLRDYEQSPDASADVARGGGYASAGECRQLSSDSRQRKRGVPWTEEEHKLFLIGLEKVGKGDWRGISRNYVKTRTPTQIASHAQKHFLRLRNLNKPRSRSSQFDIRTDSVDAVAIENGRVCNKGTIKPLSRKLSLSSDPKELYSHSSFQVTSSYNKGDSLVTVA